MAHNQHTGIKKDRSIHSICMERVQKDSETDCWNWIGAKDRNSYPRFNRIGHSPLYVHRAMYKMFKGVIPPGMLVCHHCDNPSCINPEHLFLGTYQDNILDCIRKGRNLTDYSKRSYLSDEQVDEIRNDPRSGFKLAKIYGVHPQNIHRIKSGKRRNIQSREA